jgi:hypothetical protein
MGVCYPYVSESYQIRIFSDCDNVYILNAGVNISFSINYFFYHFYFLVPVLQKPSHGTRYWTGRQFPALGRIGKITDSGY